MKSLRSLIVVFVVMLPLVSYAQSKEVEYNARRAATIVAFDSIANKADLDALIKFADMKCKEFKNDTLLMNRIAEAFSTKAQQHEIAIERFRELKRVHPKYMDGYLNYAYTTHGIGTRIINGGIELKPHYRELAKAQIDSAKIVFPKSKVPYERWLSICARYCYNSTVQSDFEKEVEAYNKAFPQANAYFVAGEILQNTEPELRQFSSSDQNGFRLTLLNFGRKFLDRSDSRLMSLEELYNLSLNYYRSINPSYDDSINIGLLGKGAELAEIGLERFPDYYSFYRRLLYNYSELADIDKSKEKDYCNKAKVAGEMWITKADQTSGEDYFYLAFIAQKMEDYSVALDNYQKALDKGLTQRKLFRDSLAAYTNMGSCYYKQNDYKNAIAITQVRNEMQTNKKKQLAREDLATLGQYYDKFGRDTLNSIEERYVAFLKSDSLYTIIQERINDGIYKNPKASDGSLMSGMYTFRRMQNSVYVKSLLKRDEVSPHEIARQLVDILKPIAEKSRVERNYLGTAYVQLMMYYEGAKDYKNALENIQLAESACPGIISDMGFNYSYDTMVNTFKKKIR